MLKREIFKRAFWLLVILGILQVVTSRLYLHWSLWWIDIILHFIGGLTVSLFTLWFFASVSDLKSWSRQKVLLVALIGAISVGVLWEVYELSAGLTFLSDGARYFSDTGSDLIMDFVGGIFGFLWTTRLMKKYEQ